MRITGMRIEGAKPDLNTLMRIVSKLEQRFKQAGFETCVEQVSSTSIHIGLNMRTFTIDVAKLGYNADRGQWAGSRCKAGYKRTRTPTWDQRVQFNDIVNEVLNQYSVVCSVRSGEYVVRTRGRAYSESDWDYNDRSYDITSITQTIVNRLSA